MNFLFLLLQYLLPKHLLSRAIGKLAASERPWFKNRFIRYFIRRYQVDMSEAQCQTPDDFRCFNDFFTRALLPDVRPVCPAADAIASPADGKLSALGRIEEGTLVQAKGHHYSLQALLGGSQADAELFSAGSFATVYLSPRDYHRVHMPLAGQLRSMTFVPGELFSVNKVTTENVPNLFARNERVVCLFDTAHGPMAVVLVGATIVASIETVWAGQVAPSRQRLYTETYQDRQPPLFFDKGEEMGRFKLGSTAIVLFGAGMARWSDALSAGCAVRMGEEIGRLQPSG